MPCVLVGRSNVTIEHLELGILWDLYKSKFTPFPRMADGIPRNYFFCSGDNLEVSSVP